jgi:16S rRNA (uracil1498-N3)-methyltransferase
MHRFFIDKANIEGSHARIFGEDVDHIAKVLRLREGNELRLCDGECREWSARIVSIGKKAVLAELIASIEVHTEPDCRITLYQGIQKAGKFETVVQKGVELGVCAFVPFNCERAVAKPWSAQDKRQDRYARVAMEAAKQCGRGIVPQVAPPISFDELCERSGRHELTLLLWEEEKERSLKDALVAAPNATDIAVIVGPEGGISKEEAKALSDCGAVSVSLGSRILRTETAGPAAAAMILYEKDDMAP